MAKVSLITVSYNSAKTIADTLRSVAGQDYGDIEHIIVDGGSKDDTMTIVEREGAHLAKAVSGPDKGIYDAYNKGLEMASGEIIGFINSDDYYASPTAISEVAQAFRDNPELEALHADLIYVDQDDTAKIVRYWRGREATPANLSRGFIAAHPTLFLRRAVYDKAGGFNLKYRLAADYEFMLRIFYTLKVRSCHLPRIWVRMRAGGATGGTLGSIKQQNVEIRDAQRLHKLDCPRWRFVAHKMVDRAVQRMRAYFVDLQFWNGSR
ncbi:MAG: glycosyltransferase family 2 protein [Novosphingobium sp.]|nr:glycosyltransferase family 2 protein [Novosphingobium sp.]